MEHSPWLSRTLSIVPKPETCSPICSNTNENILNGIAGRRVERGLARCESSLACESRNELRIAREARVREHLERSESDASQRLETTQNSDSGTPRRDRATRRVAAESRLERAALHEPKSMCVCRFELTSRQRYVFELVTIHQCY